MNKRLVVILSIITIDAIGIGLIFPILPSLLKQVTGSGEVSLMYGVILALYSLMQFVFSPVLGALSDRFGRRPVLLVSIAGAAIDFLVMALSKAFWVLLVGRAIAGMTAANMAVATAYVSDITEERERAKRFGYMSACFGIGFIIGPVLGGLLGAVWLRGPFFAAAVINAVNFVLVFAVLPESRAVAPGRFDLSAINPLAPMRRALGHDRAASAVRHLAPLRARRQHPGHDLGALWSGPVPVGLGDGRSLARRVWALPRRGAGVPDRAHCRAVWRDPHDRHRHCL